MDLGIPNTKVYAEVLDNDTITQFCEAMALDCNVQGALMPDAHAGYTLPIGAVIKSVNQVFPSYVGYDIGCGMCSVKLEIKKDKVNFNLIKEKILELIPLGSNKHKKKQSYTLVGGTELAKDIFENHGTYGLGTLGGGNHFIEIGEGKDGYLWITIHSGSRNFGYKIAEYYMKEAAIVNIDEQRYVDEFKTKHNWRDKNPEKYDKALKEHVYRRVRARLNTKLEGHYSFDINSERGKSYIEDMNCALQFALDNRKIMIDKIVKAMGNPKKLLFINRNHNHAEIDKEYVIHRKGATHAEAGMYGVIPGNMKDGCFIVKGKGNLDSMNSSSHGAGRVLSRKTAKETLCMDEFHDQMKCVITNHTDNTIDEAPNAYKNIFEVMELQKDLVTVIDHVIPLLNIKG